MSEITSRRVFHTALPSVVNELFVRGFGLDSILEYLCAHDSGIQGLILTQFAKLEHVVPARETNDASAHALWFVRVLVPKCVCDSDAERLERIEPESHRPPSEPEEVERLATFLLTDACARHLELYQLLADLHQWQTTLLVGLSEGYEDRTPGDRKLERAIAEIAGISPRCYLSEKSPLALWELVEDAFVLPANVPSSRENLHDVLRATFVREALNHSICAIRGNTIREAARRVVADKGSPAATRAALCFFRRVEDTWLKDFLTAADELP